MALSSIRKALSAAEQARKAKARLKALRAAARGPARPRGRPHYKLRQVVPAPELYDRCDALLQAVVNAGHDPAGLESGDFISVVAKMALAENADLAVKHNLPIAEQRWSRLPSGDLELVLSFRTEREREEFGALPH